jgi:hypothetical protein
MSQRRQANLGGYNDPFRDPFGDPFFGGGQDPFAAMMQQQEHMMMNMNRMIGGMLGGFGGFGGAMGNGSNLGPGHSMLMNDASSRSTQRLPARSSSGPIVEEPDSEPVATSSHYRGGLDAQAPAMSSFSSSSFSSSSFSGGGGSGPVYFQSSTSTIRGPNGTKPLYICITAFPCILPAHHSPRPTRYRRAHPQRARQSFRHRTHHHAGWRSSPRCFPSCSKSCVFVVRLRFIV